jgi:hypothetical protein
MSEDCHEISGRLGNRTEYLGKKNLSGVVGSDIYRVETAEATVIVEIKSLTELLRHYN